LNGKIYEITNLINGKTYIGQTVCSLDKRWRGHKCSSKKSSYKLYRAIRKYGIKNFEIDLIKDDIETYDQLNYQETMFILLTNSQKLGYNMTNGGNNGPLQKGRIPWNKGKITNPDRLRIEESKRNGTFVRVPTAGWNKGLKIHSEEKKKIISEQQKERMNDPIYKTNAMKNLNDTSRANYLTTCKDCNRDFNAGNYKRHIDWHNRQITKEL